MRVWSPLLTVLLTSAVFAGCISEPIDDAADGDGLPNASVGNYTLPETITGMEPVQQMTFTLADGSTLESYSATGIWADGDLLYTSGRPGMAIVDVSDPESPVTLAVLEDDTVSRDIDIMDHPNGDKYAVLAGAPGIILVNVTDPNEPEIVSTVEIGYHNIAVVPGTALVYNSRSVYTGADTATDGGLVDIIDFADPKAPSVTEFRFGNVVMTVGGVPKVPKSPSCHDVSVYVAVDRAYCAGVTETQVWDISEPKAPKILQIIDNPGTNIHHAVYAAKDHDLLIIGDELGGAIVSPGCLASDQPYGGVWFVDISDLASPVPVGWWAPEEPHEEPVTASVPFPVRTCTAHFGNLVEDRDLLVMGFYIAGVFIIDFSDPSAPKEVDNFRGGGSVWEGRYHQGYIYTGDGQRGVDILKPVGDGTVHYDK